MKFLISKMNNLLEGLKKKSKCKDEEILSMIKEVFLLNQENINKNAIIHNCCQNDWIQSLEFLIKNKVDVNSLSKNEMTPIYYSSFESAIILIENGANINYINSKGITPLMYICGKKNYSNLKLVEMLINKGANIHTSPRTVLDCAFIAGNFELSKLLIKYGGKLNKEYQVVNSEKCEFFAKLEKYAGEDERPNYKDIFSDFSIYKPKLKQRKPYKFID
jgi:ankyrin repeat protein